MATGTTVGTDEVELPIDANLKPLIGPGKLDYWQAMAITTSRRALEAQDKLRDIEGLLKKVLEGTKQSPQDLTGITLVPNWQETGDL